MTRGRILLFKYNSSDIKNMCMSYWWICNSEVPFTEEEIKLFIQKLKGRIRYLVRSIFYVHNSTRL